VFWLTHLALADEPVIREAHAPIAHQFSDERMSFLPDGRAIWMHHERSNAQEYGSRVVVQVEGELPAVTQVHAGYYSHAPPMTTATDRWVATVHLDGSERRHVAVFDRSTGERTHLLDAGAPIRSISSTHGHLAVMLASPPYGVQFWSWNGEQVWTLPGSVVQVHAPSITSDGQWALVYGDQLYSRGQSEPVTVSDRLVLRADRLWGRTEDGGLWSGAPEEASTAPDTLTWVRGLQVGPQGAYALLDGERVLGDSVQTVSADFHPWLDIAALREQDVIIRAAVPQYIGVFAAQPRATIAVRGNAALKRAAFLAGSERVWRDTMLVENEARVTLSGASHWELVGLDKAHGVRALPGLAHRSFPGFRSIPGMPTRTVRFMLPDGSPAAGARVYVDDGFLLGLTGPDGAYHYTDLGEQRLMFALLGEHMSAATADGGTVDQPRPHCRGVEAEGTVHVTRTPCDAVDLTTYMRNAFSMKSGPQGVYDVIIRPYQ
jgi:hypothetical protein